jgi:type I restriction enzyme M protein
LNPPYKVETHDFEELEYVLNNLEMLMPAGVCIALVPISSMVAQERRNLELKQRLMKDHTLEAVMSLPEDLFHNSHVGVVTCAIVVRAHVPHKAEKKTWLAYWRDDGFTKTKGRGRIDKNHRWQKIRDSWVEAYRNRDVSKERSVSVLLKPPDEWCVEAFLGTDYSHIDKAAIERELRRYLAYEILSEDV